MSDLTDQQWRELITDGSSLNDAWKARLDEAVPYLRQLQDAGVEVLWRPLHEINDGWAWWGGRPGSEGSAALYRITYDYLVNQKGLTSLVWNWNVKDSNIENLSAYWPADDQVDVASIDMWTNSLPTDQHYNALLDVAGGRPIALGEVGTVPPPELLDRQPLWTYFMVWAEYLNENPQSEVQRTYWDDRVLVLDEMNRE